MITTIRKFHSSLRSKLPSHSQSRSPSPSPSQSTPHNQKYAHSLYITISTSLLTIILILISLFYQFPGPNNSLLDIVGPDITYKIYVFQYCVYAGDGGDGGVSKDVYAPDGEGCHLDFNPIGYVVSATKIRASDTDLHLFHSLTAAAFSFYYIGIHIQILLTYLFIRSFLRTGKSLYAKLIYFLGFQTTIYLIPAICLTSLTYLARRIITTSSSSSSSSASSNYKRYSKIGNLYALFLHSFWIIWLVALVVVVLGFCGRGGQDEKERVEGEMEVRKYGQEMNEKWEEAREEWGEPNNKSIVHDARRNSNPHTPIIAEGTQIPFWSRPAENPENPEILNHWNEPNKVP